MNELGEKAKEALPNYLNLDELISRYPEKVTINGLHNVLPNKYGAGEYAQLRFAEDKYAIFPAGAGELKKMVKAWLEYVEGDLTALDAMLKQNPVKVKIWKEKQTGKNYPFITKVKVLE